MKMSGSAEAVRLATAHPNPTIVISTPTLFLAVPFAFLAGLMRSHLSRAAGVRRLVTGLAARTEERHGLREALAQALRDPSLSLAYWLPDGARFVDSGGQTVEVPPPDPSRACTEIALRSERLDAELRAKVEELRESRARIAESGDSERRRLERDLHDGAQQRLVALALNLRLARAKLAEAPDTAAKLLESSAGELDLALAELRELARGIHPAILSDRGLPAALEGLADRAPVPVALKNDSGQLPHPFEAAAYFVVAEALTNVGKYAGATRATVEVSRDNGRVVVQVADDGADPSKGSGLRGLADRVAALDGRLEVDSAPGRGSIVRARIPCG